MSFINDKSREINCKIIYYGPAQCGKSTSLRCIYDRVRKGAKGEMISLAQDDDRTLYFDFVPLNLGTIKGHAVRLHLYTVPGEAGYRQSRSLISRGVDGVVFVADSQLTRMEANLKALADLKEMLAVDGNAWAQTPVVFQYNKRDLAGAIPTQELARYLNEDDRTAFETVATRGQNVFEAFLAVTKDVLQSMR